MQVSNQIINHKCWEIKRKEEYYKKCKKEYSKVKINLMLKLKLKMDNWMDEGDRIDYKYNKLLIYLYIG